MRKLIVLVAALLMTALLQGCGTAGDTPGNGGTGDIPLSGSSGSSGDAAPTITFTGFTVVQVDGQLSGKVVAFFSEDMDPATITAQSFIVRGPDNKAVAGTVLYIGVTAVFTPNERFASKTHYEAVITTGVRSLAGVPMANRKTFGFTTPSPSELTGVLVRVASTEPSNYATQVALDSGVNVTFHQIMDPESINESTVAVFDQAGGKVAGQVHYSGLTASFVPSSPLHSDTTYRLTVSASARSLSGIPMDQDYKSLFTTAADGATLAPQVVSTSPLLGDGDVSTDSTVVVDFNEAMDTNTVNSSNIQVSDDQGIPVAGTVTYAGDTAIFTPDTAFLPGTTYTAQVGDGVTSAGGVPLAQAYSWSFTTAASGTGTAPTVVFTNPAAWQSFVSSSATISVAFSSVLDPSSVNTGTFQVVDQYGTPVAGSVSYLGNVAMFTPDGYLAPGTEYTVTLTSGIRSSDGVSLTSYSWNFTTMMIM